MDWKRLKRSRVINAGDRESHRLKPVLPKIRRVSIEGKLEGHCAVLRLKFRQRDHINRIPRTAFEKSSIRPFARAEFAADAKYRVHHNPAKWCVLFIRHPEHAFSHGAIVDARRRSGATRAHLVDYGNDVRLALPFLGVPLRNRVELFDVAVDEPRYVQGSFSHQSLRGYSV